MIIVFFFRWSLIAGRIPGRTAEEIEKYWTSRYSTSEWSAREWGKDCKHHVAYEMKVDLITGTFLGMFRPKKGGMLF